MKLKIVIAITLSLSILSSTCNAADAVYLNKNQPAPYAGYLIDQAKATAVRNNQIDLDTQKKVNLNLTQENTLINERLQNAQQQSNYLSDQLAKERDTSFLSKAAFFVFGALTVGLVSYGVYKTK